ncbi:hypothetical protein [Spirabiliibacterium falconis]|uniref:hypothetical protein n=1 Tax=Spirabiliibacterium falconis TaxID=572023 RepID=UPI001AADA25C|nr:hypothetical protein [Spirabiliibacterium falconis]MBE2893654.1 hypothetical protein [Spirabiliibacterium falconis]
MRLCSRSLLLVIGLTELALAVCASSPSNIKPEVIAAQRIDAQSELAGKLPEHEANCYPISHIYLTDFSDNGNHRQKTQTKSILKRIECHLSRT